MEEFNWEKCEIYQDSYNCKKTFNGCEYVISITVEHLGKSVRYWPCIRSGKKRSQQKDYIYKRDKSTGGLKALIWIKNAILVFPESEKRYAEGKTQYICIGWEDNRRRDIYARLQKEGFRFTHVDGGKILMKKL